MTLRARAFVLLLALAAIGGSSCGHRRATDEEAAWERTDVPPPPVNEAHFGDDGRMLIREPVIVAPVPPGIAVPYALDRIYGTFGDCRPGGRQHQGLDIGGTGLNAGLGTSVRSLVRAEVVAIRRPEDEPELYGRRDTRNGTTERSGVDLPRSFEIPGYGRVYFFTRDHGSWRTGEMIETRALDTGLAGHRIRYMHLGAVQPELRVGDVVEAGQEIGVMGGTAILESLPHVHIDITDERGRRVDVAPWLGMEPDRGRCR